MPEMAFSSNTVFSLCQKGIIGLHTDHWECVQTQMIRVSDL